MLLNIASDLAVEQVFRLLPLLDSLTEAKDLYLICENIDKCGPH